jgi:hypothetical protein
VEMKSDGSISEGADTFGSPFFRWHLGGFVGVASSVQCCVVCGRLRDGLGPAPTLDRSPAGLSTGALTPGVARGRQCGHSAADRGACRPTGRVPASGNFPREALWHDSSADERSAVTAGECGVRNTRNAWAQNDIAAVKFGLRACMRSGELSREFANWMRSNQSPQKALNGKADLRRRRAPA